MPFFQDFFNVSCSIYNKHGKLKYNHMIPNIKKLLFLALFSIMLFSSCRDEYSEDISGTKEEPNLKKSSSIADLIQRTAMNDGSKDNIIDQANCFSLKLPATVIVNSTTVSINSEEDFDTVEDLLEDDDEVQIVFPVTILLSDYTEVTILNQSEFDSFKDDCNEEDEEDDDIECLDFKYPIKIFVYDPDKDQTKVVVTHNDEEMYGLIKDLEEDSEASIKFPIMVTLYDDSEVRITNLEELENTINSVKNNCDEDDDYNFDDDCQDCSTEQLENVFLSCTKWSINKLRISNTNLEDNYSNHLFEFLNNGTITVDEGSNTYSGTWNSTGSGENITVTINIPSLPDFNGAWDLHNIEGEGSQKKIELRLNGNRLRFKTTCD